MIEYSAVDEVKPDRVVKHYILASSDSAVEDDALRSLFDQHGQQLLNSGANPAAAHGRGKVHFFEHAGRKLVMRQYRRGGLIGRLVERSYLWTGLENTRPFRELVLLSTMQAMSVAACYPFAARIVRNGLAYQAQLITEQVTNAHTLGELLQSNAVSDAVFRATGKAIRVMHDQNIHHADLNANNILIRDAEAVLIDFDRGGFRHSELVDWRAASLKRLLRSIHKLQQRHNFEFSDLQWQTLMQGYQATNLC